MTRYILLQIKRLKIYPNRRPVKTNFIQTDWTNETNEIDHNFDAKIDINDGGNDYLIDFLMDEIRPEDFDEEGESFTITSQVSQIIYYFYI